MQRLISAFTVLYAVVIRTIITMLSTPLNGNAAGISCFTLSFALPPQAVHRALCQRNVDTYFPLHQFPLFRGCFIAFITHLTWEFSSLLFRSSTIQPITISHLTADPVWHSYPVYPPHFSIPVPLLCRIRAKSSISPSALSCPTKCIHQASRPPISSTTGT